MNIQPLSQPPPMVRLANGQFVPAQTLSRSQPNRRFLVVVQYFEGDKRDAEDLCALIADLERVKNRDADILLFARADATEPSHDIKTKLEAKFERVLFERCRRKDAKGHPWGANGMFYDLVTLFGQVAPWAERYFAFVPLEPDCVPTRPGWIHELIAAFRSADASGRGCAGFIHNDPIRHMNGVGVYAIDIWARVGSNKLAGGNPQVAYDIRHANDILPLAEDSPLFYFEFRRPTITAEELFAERRAGVSPAVWHGVKDTSARAAVRARHVTFTEQQEIDRKTVMTFFEARDQTSPNENMALLEAWREAWKSRGWNPVVLSMRDATAHGRFKTIAARIESLPYIGSKQAHLFRFARWIALARMGGGLMVDYDLVPEQFTPHNLPTGPLAIIDDSSKKLCGLRFDRETVGKWLDAIESYDPTPDDVVDEKPCVTDATVLTAAEDALGIVRPTNFVAATPADEDWPVPMVIHFSESAIQKRKAGVRKSEAIETYLTAKT